MQFKNPRDPENLAIIQKVIEWTRQKLHIPEDVKIAVSEVNCLDANCSDSETLILIYTDPEQSLRIRKPLVFVRKWDFV